MLGGIKGYCSLKSLEGVFIGYDRNANPNVYAEIERLLLEAPFLRIVDIGCDGSLLVVDPTGICICDIRERTSVMSMFECEDFGGVLLPPGLSFLEKMVESEKRIGRAGGYSDTVRKMVVMVSLHKGKLTDEFLFACQCSGHGGNGMEEGL